jgi:signal transduction histidine kinase
MQLKGRVMGVIAVLSEEPRAFGMADLDILRTLGAYAAVAYDNAEAYHRLQLAQDRLVEQEKLAALGALVAGVAHELNTPIGNSLLMASTLRDASRDFIQRAQAGGLRKSELQAFCEGSDASTSLLLRSLEQATNLIASFKQLAVDQTSDQRRRFDLAQTVEEVVMTLASRIRREEHDISLDLQPGLILDSFPGPLGQVVSNLVLNAMLHGFAGRKGGHMRLSVQAMGPDQVLVDFSDNGAGIPPEHLRRIFEPFFTTRLGQGGSGLGLHICYNIVHSLLGGSIRVQSVMGEGTRFLIELPRIAPLEGDEAAAQPLAPRSPPSSSES